MPVPGQRVPSGTMMLEVADAARPGQVVVYAWVSSADQRADLDRQVARVTGQGLAVSRVVTEVGSALNGRRKKFLVPLRNRNVTTIVVEHRVRFARLGAEYVEAAVFAQGRWLMVVDPVGVDDDLVPGVTEFLTSLCARLYGPRASGEPGQPRRGRRRGPFVKRYEPPAGWIVHAYRFALDPSDVQVLGLRRNSGAARFAYNHMLRRVSAVKAQRTAEASYGVAEASLTPWQGWSVSDLRCTWNQIKQWVAPWWAQCSKEAFNTGLANLSAALGNWHASLTGTRKERRMGWPRAKKRHGRRSARFTTGAIRVDRDYRHVVLPRLGRIRTHESTRKLARRVRAGTATILWATVTETAGRWFCSFQVAVGRTTGRPAHAPRAGRVVGADAGIKHLAVLSTGELVPNPAPLKVALRKLGKAQRRAARKVGPYDPATRRTRTPSNRWRRAQDAVVRLHATVAPVRVDSWHQLTTRLAQQFTTVVVEDLHVAGA